MAEKIEEQLELLNETGVKPLKPDNGAGDKKEEHKKASEKSLKRIFSPEDMEKIFGQEEELSAEKPNRPSQVKTMSGPSSQPRRRPASKAEIRLGWAGRYWGNDPDDPRQ